MPHQCARWFAMTGVESAAVVGGGTHGCRPTGDKRGCGGQRRVVGDADPYGGDKKGGTDCHGAMRLAMTGFGECDGRPQGSPLRRDRGAVRAGRRGRRPLRRATRREYGLPRQSARWLAMTGFDNKIKRRTSKRPPFCIKLREKSEVFDDLHDLGADALLSLHGGGADMSGRLENVPVAHF